MNIDPHELAAELPPLRDGEPPSLRQDIIDELSDHLHCATNQEILRGRKPAEAFAAALDHFGNPAIIARQLWFDAMKGRLMQSKLMILLMGILIGVGCVIIAGLWRATQLQQRAIEMQMAALQAQAQAERTAAPSEWSKLQVRCVDSTGGPVEGIHVDLHPISASADIPNASDVTNGQGEIDWGFVKYGQYMIVSSIRRDGINFSAKKHFTVMPGRDELVNVEIPGSEMPTRLPVQVKLVHEAPVDNEISERLWTIALLQSSGPSMASEWHLSPHRRFWLFVGPQQEFFVCPADAATTSKLQISAEVAEYSSDTFGRFTKRIWTMPSKAVRSRELPVGSYSAIETWCAIEGADQRLFLDPVTIELFRYEDRVDRITVRQNALRYDYPSQRLPNELSQFDISEPFEIRVPALDVKLWQLTGEAPENSIGVTIFGQDVSGLDIDAISKGVVQIALRYPTGHPLDGRPLWIPDIPLIKYGELLGPSSTGDFYRNVNVWLSPEQAQLLEESMNDGRIILILASREPAKVAVESVDANSQSEPTNAGTLDLDSTLNDIDMFGD